MKCQALLFIVIGLAHAAQGYKIYIYVCSYSLLIIPTFLLASEISSLKMIMPQNVFMNEDIHGKCITSLPTDIWPHVVIKKATGCKFKIRTKRRMVVQDTIKLHCTNFVVKNVTATCEYMCVSNQHVVIKTVVVSSKYMYAA